MDQSGYGVEDAGFVPGPAPVPEVDSADAARRGEVFAFFSRDAEDEVEAAPADSGQGAPWSTSFSEPLAVDEPSEVFTLDSYKSDYDYAAPADSGFFAPAPTDTAGQASVPAQGSYAPIALEPETPFVAAPRVMEPAIVQELTSGTFAAANELTALVAQSEVTEAAYARSSTESETKEDDANLVELLSLVVERGASDLHLTTGARPTLRVNGALEQLPEFPILTPPVLQRILYGLMTQKQRERFEETLELDFSYSVPGKSRFRVNVYRQRDSLGAAFRLIPYEIKRLEDLGVSPTVSNFASLPRGFVLVTGPTGSGKSTTLAAIVDLANRTRSDHIMTVEDPIEFLHRHQRCIVNQREVGEDTWSFQNALKHVLRQDPDIILVGEMRDLETISVALTAAETGHLVFATLHTQDAAQTIDRVIDVFPPHQQQQIRVQLSASLQGVVCQTLAKRADGRGRVVATEVLVATPAVRNLIREGKTHQIYSAMQAGGKFGMQTMDQNIAELVKRGTITYEHGLEKCHHVEDFNRLVGRA